jgi:hypothetical protein
MKKITFIKKGWRINSISKSDLRKEQKARIRQLRMAVHFANQVLENPELKERYESLAKEKNFPDAYAAAVRIFLNTEANMRSTLRRIKDN